MEALRLGVTGLRSGLHSGKLVLATDGRTLVFRPERPFDASETVTVEVARGLRTAGEPMAIVRSREPYGINEPLGLDYTFDYKAYYTSRSWEDSFFGYLASIAVPKPLTEWQQAYNAQKGVLDVTTLPRRADEHDGGA